MDEQQLSPIPVVEKHHLRRPFAIVLAVVSVLAAVDAFAFYAQVGPYSSKPTPTPMVQATSTPGPMVGWKTYTDSQLGFQFNYPASFVSDPNTSILTLSDSRMKCEVGSELLNFSPDWTQTDQDIMIDGNRFKKYQYYKDKELIIISYSSLAPKSAGFTLHSTVRDAPITADCLSAFDQILSTFKFTDSADISTWKTYTNTQYGFELSFPESWRGYSIQPTDPVMGSTDHVTFVHPEFLPNARANFIIGIYTPAQWEQELKLDHPHPLKLGQNVSYVFATYFRFENNNAPGEADIDQILSTFKFTK